MAISVGKMLLFVSESRVLRIAAVLVGNAQSWLPELIERAKKLKVNQGFEQGTDLYVFAGFGRHT